MSEEANEQAAIEDEPDEEPAVVEVPLLLGMDQLPCSKNVFRLTGFPPEVGGVCQLNGGFDVWGHTISLEVKWDQGTRYSELGASYEGWRARGQFPELTVNRVFSDPTNLPVPHRQALAIPRRCVVDDPNVHGPNNPIAMLEFLIENEPVLQTHRLIVLRIEHPPAQKGLVLRATPALCASLGLGMRLGGIRQVRDGCSTTVPVMVDEDSWPGTIELALRFTKRHELLQLDTYSLSAAGYRNFAGFRLLVSRTFPKFIAIDWECGRVEAKHLAFMEHMDQAIVPGVTMGGQLFPTGENYRVFPDLSNMERGVETWAAATGFPTIHTEDF
jgi:hypothetical protein